MSIDTEKTKEFVAALRKAAPDTYDQPVNLDSDISRIVYRNKKWYTQEQFAAMAQGEESRGYTFPPMSHTTHDLNKESAEKLRGMAQAAGLNCDIIASDILPDAELQRDLGKWHLNLHGRETLQAFAAADRAITVRALEGRSKA